jgi:hypothetical protein
MYSPFEQETGKKKIIRGGFAVSKSETLSRSAKLPDKI